MKKLHILSIFFFIVVIIYITHNTESNPHENLSKRLDYKKLNKYVNDSCPENITINLKYLRHGGGVFGTCDISKMLKTIRDGYGLISFDVNDDYYLDTYYFVQVYKGNLIYKFYKVKGNMCYFVLTEQGYLSYYGWRKSIEGNKI